MLSALLLFGLCSCTHKKDYVILEKDLIPEGTAFNERTKTVYIGSIYKQKIVGITSKGEVQEVITSDQFGPLSPLGMEMDNQNEVLWVNAVQAPIVKSSRVPARSAVLAFDMNTGQILEKYELEAGMLLNDLTLDAKGNVFVTETIGGKIYKIEKGADRLQPFHELKTQSGPNGIVYHTPTESLFVSTDQGIVKVEIRTGASSLLATPNNIDAKVIDGLAMYKNYFIGHQSTKVSKFYFDPDHSTITHAEVLDTGKEFDSSTTGEIAFGDYYFIVNSQLKSGIDRQQKIVKPLDSLENIIVRRIKL